MFFLEEARICRSLATSFEGKPEGVFLLDTARAFEDLALEGAPWQGSSHPFTQILNRKESPLVAHVDPPKAAEKHPADLRSRS